MKKILVLGNTGLNQSNNSTNNRMKKIFEVIYTQYKFEFDYYQLREAVLEVEYINYLNKKANPSPLHAYKAIIKENTNYEIVLAETFNAAIIAYMLFFKTKTPFIWRQFGNTFNDELTFKNYFKPKILFKFFLHKLIANSFGCKAVVCTEDGCANRTLYLEKLGMSADKLYMVKNQRTKNSLKKIEDKSLLNSDNFKIVQVGRITSWKKIHLLIEAIINIKNKYPEIANKIELNIIGQTQDIEYENRLKEEILKHQLDKQIFFKKDLEYHQIEEIFQTTNLSISLTAYNPIIESLQNEIPVITYEYGEIGEVFNDCNAVFILAKDIKKSSFLSKDEESRIVKELEEKIIVLFKQKELLHNLGREGREFVENNFPLLDEHVSEIINIYMKEKDAL
jgi:glycosyltransferase involved in cell wall biosynthesis